MNALLSRLTIYGLKQIAHDRFLCRCPSHEDKSPSLTITLQSGDKTLIHCFAGCQPVEIMAAIDMTVSDLFPSNDNFDRQEYKRKQNIQFQRDQFMKDYRLVKLGDIWIEKGRLLSDNDIKSIQESKKRIYQYKFDAHEVYEKMIVQDAAQAGLERAHYKWQHKTLREKYYA